jgi:hypothetical protein
VLDVPQQRLVDGGHLCMVAAEAQCFVQQLIVDRDFGCRCGNLHSESDCAESLAIAFSRWLTRASRRHSLNLHT